MYTQKLLYIVRFSTVISCPELYIATYTHLQVTYILMYVLLCRPSLGAQMSKVFAAGGIYGVFAFLDGITRSYSVSL